MQIDGIDQTDARILYLLKDDARNTTTSEIGDALEIAKSTVGTRIRKLEDEGIITNYEPRVDYDKLGYEHQYVIAGTAPFEKRQEVVDDVSNVSNVVGVRNMMTTEINVAVKIVGSSRRSVENSIEELQARNLSINRIEILEKELHQPVHIFREYVKE